MAEETNKPELAADLTTALLAHFMSLVAEDPLTMPGAGEMVPPLRAAAAGRGQQLPAGSGGGEPRPRSAAPPLPPRRRAYGAAGRWSDRTRDGRRSRASGAAQAVAGCLHHGGTSVRSPAGNSAGRRGLLTGIESAWHAGLRVLGVGPLSDQANTGHADAWVAALDDPELLRLARDWPRPQSPDVDRDQGHHGPH